MPLGINRTLHKTYDEAVAKGHLSTALTIASREARINEERDDPKQTGGWLRKVTNALLLQGRYAEGSLEAERSAEIRPDPYERTRALFILAANDIFACKHHQALLTIGKIEELTRA